MNNTDNFESLDNALLGSEQARARLEECSRFAQAGRCVSGVTHDINNYLGAVMAYAELVGLEEGLSEESRRMLVEVVGAISKCTSLLGVLTAVAREAEKTSVDMLDAAVLAREALSVHHYALRIDQVDLSVDIEENLASVLGDGAKVQLALTHLLMNAREALAGVADKQVRLGLRGVEGGVEFTVWNSGPPIPEARRDAIFAPFTTSKTGIHLGLGLPVVRDIAELHGGSVAYDAERGFVLYLARANSLDKLL